MIAALVPLVLCGLTFVEQDIPDVDLRGMDALSGQHNPNFLRADFDGDGTLDLLLPRYLAFQRGSGFSRTQVAPIPDFGESPHCDLWGRDIYLCLSNRIEVIRWNGDQWKRILSQQLVWPDGSRFKTFGSPLYFEDSKALRFFSFLQDLNGDGKPEIIVPASDSVHVYRQGELFFEDVAQWDIYPPVQMMHSMKPIWPERARTVDAMWSGWSCMLHVSGPNLLTEVEDMESLDSPTTEYRIETRTLTFENGFAVAGEPKPPNVYTVPSNARRCKLNEDDVPDFVKYEVEKAKTGPIPFPVLTLTVSTDGGVSWTTVRSPVLMQQCFFADVNGDKRLDLIAETNGLFQGGLRELATSYLTGRSVTHTVNIVPQQADGKFVQGQAFSVRCPIRVDAPPIQNSPMFGSYQSGLLVNLSGDFTGDGLLDLAVHEAPDRIAIYPNTGSGFASSSVAVVQTAPDCVFSVADVDGDKRADMVLSLKTAGDDPQSPSPSRLFLSRETTP